MVLWFDLNRQLVSGWFSLHFVVFKGCLIFIYLKVTDIVLSVGAM
jgi:hypothetical protein